MSYTISKFGQCGLKLRLDKDEVAGCLKPRNDGTCDAGRRIIRNVADPELPEDAATKHYVQEAVDVSVRSLLEDQEQIYRKHISGLGKKMDSVKTEIVRDLRAMDEHITTVRREVIDRLNIAVAQTEENLQKIEKSIIEKLRTSIDMNTDVMED